VQERSTCRSKLYVIGVGPGDHDHMAYRAKSVKIGESEITIGYYTHVSLVEDMIDGKEVYRYGMTQETYPPRKLHKAGQI
jgi:precorrin-3B C17-methyltransferase